jgi:hypothetical protein
VKRPFFLFIFLLQVFFVDYGTSFRIARRALCFLHVKFSQLPTQAFKASLVHLVPVGGREKWPRETVGRFRKLVKNKMLTATVSTVDHEVTKLLSGYVIVKY